MRTEAEIRAELAEQERKVKSARILRDWHMQERAKDRCQILHWVLGAED